MNDWAETIIVAAFIIAFVLWGTYTIIWIWS